MVCASATRRVQPAGYELWSPTHKATLPLTCCLSEQVLLRPPQDATPQPNADVVPSFISHQLTL